jgi:hypothetical protein
VLPSVGLIGGEIARSSISASMLNLGGLADQSQLDLTSELDHASRRDLEEFGSRKRVAVHELI